MIFVVKRQAGLRKWQRLFHSDRAKYRKSLLSVSSDEWTFLKSCMGNLKRNMLRPEVDELFCNEFSETQPVCFAEFVQVFSENRAIT